MSSTDQSDKTHKGTNARDAPDAIDQISYAGLMSIVYLAVIGATWRVCRKSFAELLANGQVDVLATVTELAKAPKKKKKKKKKNKNRKPKKSAPAEREPQGD